MVELDRTNIVKLLSVAKSAREKDMYQKLLDRIDALNPPPPKLEEKPKVKQEAKVIPKTLVKPKPNKSLPQVSNEVIQSKPQLEPLVNPIFQAIGILKGDITFSEGNKALIKVGDNEYPLYPLPRKKRKVFSLLRKEVETTGVSTQRVIVYPRFTHFPSRDEPPMISFQLVGFVNSNETNTNPNKKRIESQLKDFEFILKGLWQFIPVCKTPCVSIYKNFTSNRLDWLKQTEPYKQVKFMKGTHLPLLWRDASVRPFKFNPKVEKSEIGKPYFIAVKAKFLPQREVFAFIEELGQALQDTPKFLKASKKLKAEALNSKSNNTQTITKDVDEVNE